MLWVVILYVRRNIEAIREITVLEVGKVKDVLFDTPTISTR